MSPSGRVPQDRFDTESREALRIAEDALYSSKAHYNDADTYGHVTRRLGYGAAILAAAAGSVALTEWSHATTTAVCLSFASAVVSVVLTLLNPADRSSRHHIAGVLYGELRAEARRVAERSNSYSYAELKSANEHLSQRKSVLNQSSPQPSNKAYERARTGIENGESAYEIDTKG